MKKNLLILLMILFASCKDEKASSSINLHENEVKASETIPPGNIQEERDALMTEKEKPRTAAVLNGKYRKVVNGKSAADCNCNCIDINFDSPTDWCIVKDKIYISARCERTGDNTADLYFISASRDEDPDRKLPWEDFDIDQPIASIQFHPNGEAEIDWKGFMTDGKLAVDYAIYGKKTLEGTYIKE